MNKLIALMEYGEEDIGEIDEKMVVESVKGATVIEPKNIEPIV
jgi:hypothetical protein